MTWNQVIQAIEKLRDEANNLWSNVQRYGTAKLPPDAMHKVKRMTLELESYNRKLEV